MPSKGKLAFVKGAVALGCAAAALAGGTGVASASVGLFAYRLNGVPKVLHDATDGECFSLDGRGTDFRNFTDTTVQLYEGHGCMGDSTYMEPHSGPVGSPSYAHSFRFLN